MTQTQNQNILQWFTSKFDKWWKICIVLACIALVLFSLGYAVQKGAITPQQSQNLFNSLQNQLLQLQGLSTQLNQSIGDVNATLITSWQDTIGDPSFYTTQQPYAYVVSNVSNYFCLQNGATGYLQAYSLSYTQTETWALGNTTKGTVIAKKILEDFRDQFGRFASSVRLDRCST